MTDLSKSKHHSPFEAIIYAFAREAAEPFEMKTLLAHVKPLLHFHPKNLEKLIRRVLDQDQWVFYNKDTKLFVPRTQIFQGRSFLIKLTPLEIEMKCLIPGHRFLPFAPTGNEQGPPALFPADSKRPLRLKEKLFHMHQLGVFYSMRGIHQLISDTIPVDDLPPHGALAIGADIEKERVMLPVYNLSYFLKRHKLTPEGGLKVTCVSYSDQVFTFEPVDHIGTIEDEFLVRRWSEELEKTLMRINQNYGPRFNVEAQLALAFFLNPRLLERTPPIHVGGALVYFKDLGLQELNSMPIIWNVASDVEHIFLDHAEATRHKPLGALESIPDILSDLGIQVNLELINAYILDGLFSGQKSYKAVYNHIDEVHGGFHFYDKEQEKVFRSQLKAHFNHMAANYDASKDKKLGNLRHRALGLFNKFWTVTRMGAEEQDLDPGEIFPLSAMGMLMGELTGLMNTAHDDEAFDPAALQFLNENLTQLEMMFDAMVDDYLGKDQEAPEAHPLPETRQPLQPIKPHALPPKAEQEAPEPEPAPQPKPTKNPRFKVYEGQGGDES